MDFQDEVELLIRARYPILFLQTNEELRVQEAVQRIAARQRKPVFEWSCTTGLIPAGTSIQSSRTRQTTTRDPLAALDHVIDHVEPALYLFKDLHPFLGKAHAATVRRLKEIAQHLKNSQKTLLLLSPSLEIPIELEKEITLVPCPLPDRLELDRLLDRLAVEVQSHSHLNLDLGPEARHALLQAALGLTWAEAENVFARILVEKQRLTAEDVPEVLREKKQIVRKSGLLEYYEPEETLAQVGGLGILKDWLHKRTRAFSDEARTFGLPAPKGVMLLGVQGCGKTLCAKAVASLWRLPLLRFDMGRMFSSLVGSSEENARRAIAVAESVAPSILWVDEIDKAFAGSQASGAVDGGTTARVFGTFLTWLSEKSAPVFVVATANDISRLPPELLRKGRLDEIFFVDLPDAADRLEIFSIHLRKRHRPPAQFDLAAFVEASRQFSGAEIEQALVSALYDAFADQTELTTAHVLEALRQTVPLATTMSESVENLRHWAKGRARHASQSDGI